MKYTLDTNVCIRYLNGRSRAIRSRLPTIAAIEITVCSIVRAELAFGAEKSSSPSESHQKQQRFLEPYANLDFGAEAALVFGRIRAFLEKAGTPIGPYDMQIAAIAVVNNLIVVTHNRDEFGRIPGLRLEDWEDS